jgi:hypothetical protein
MFLSVACCPEIAMRPAIDCPAYLCAWYITWRTAGIRITRIGWLGAAAFLCHPHPAVVESIKITYTHCTVPGNRIVPPTWLLGEELITREVFI